MAEPIQVVVAEPPEMKRKKTAAVSTASRCTTTCDCVVAFFCWFCGLLLRLWPLSLVSLWLRICKRVTDTMKKHCDHVQTCHPHNKKPLRTWNIYRGGAVDCCSCSHRPCSVVDIALKNNRLLSTSLCILGVLIIYLGVGVQLSCNN